MMIILSILIVILDSIEILPNSSISFPIIRGGKKEGKRDSYAVNSHYIHLLSRIVQ